VRSIGKIRDCAKSVREAKADLKLELTDEEEDVPDETDFHSICHLPIQKVEVVSDVPVETDFEWRICNRRCPFYEVDGPFFGGPGFTCLLYWETGPYDGHVEACDAEHLELEHPVKIFRVNRQPDAPWIVKQLPVEFRLASRQSQRINEALKLKRLEETCLKLNVVLSVENVWSNLTLILYNMTRRTRRWFKVWADVPGEAGDVRESTSSSSDDSEEAREPKWKPVSVCCDQECLRASREPLVIWVSVSNKGLIVCVCAI